MATRGFEFAGMLDGTNSTPVIRDLPVNGTGLYSIGDLVVLDSAGQATAITASAAEVTGVIQEKRSSGGTDGDIVKMAIASKDQIWRCSMDASSSAAVVGYTKTLDVADANTVDADDTSNGSLTLWDTGTDDEGNVLAYVVFSDTTFGNA